MKNKMKFVDSTAKTNWKFIAIVVVLGFAIGGGVFWYAQLLNQQIRQLETSNVTLQIPKEKKPKIDTSGWQTYRNEEFGFEVRYPSDYEIRLSLGYKLREFSACNQTRCAMFLAIYQAPLELSTSGPYQSYRRVEAPDYLEDGFYYYSIDTRDPEINQILSTFRFVE